VKRCREGNNDSGSRAGCCPCTTPISGGFSRAAVLDRRDTWHSETPRFADDALGHRSGTDRTTVRNRAATPAFHARFFSPALSSIRFDGFGTFRPTTVANVVDRDPRSRKARKRPLPLGPTRNTCSDMDTPLINSLGQRQHDALHAGRGRRNPPGVAARRNQESSKTTDLSQDCSER